MDVAPIIAIAIGTLLLLLHFLGINSFHPFYYRLGFTIYRRDYQLSRPLLTEAHFLELDGFRLDVGIARFRPSYRGCFRAKQDPNPRRMTIYSLTGDFRIVDEILEVTVRFNPTVVLAAPGMILTTMLSRDGAPSIALFMLGPMLLIVIGVTHALLIANEFSVMKKTAQAIFTRIQKESNQS